MTNPGLGTRPSFNSRSGAAPLPAHLLFDAILDRNSTCTLNSGLWSCLSLDYITVLICALTCILNRVQDGQADMVRGCKLRRSLIADRASSLTTACSLRVLGQRIRGNVLPKVSLSMMVRQNNPRCLRSRGKSRLALHVGNRRFISSS